MHHCCWNVQSDRQVYEVVSGFRSSWYWVAIGRVSGTRQREGLKRKGCTRTSHNTRIIAAIGYPTSYSSLLRTILGSHTARYPPRIYFRGIIGLRYSNTRLRPSGIRWIAGNNVIRCTLRAHEAEDEFSAWTARIFYSYSTLWFFRRTPFRQLAAENLTYCLSSRCA